MSSGYPKAFLFVPVSLILIAGLGIAVYANSLGGKFIWDDEGLVEKNIYIKDFKHIPDIFEEDIGSGNIAQGGGQKRTFSYRPLQMLTYALDYMLWKDDVRGYHLTNILLHILTSILIYLFIIILFKDNLIALLTGIFFVVHPIHTEAISYISGRADPLSCIFIFLSLIMYVKNIELNNKLIYIILPACYIAAILSRESSIILPLLILIYHFIFRKRLDLKAFLPVIFISIFYLILRLTALKGLSPHLDSNTAFWQRIPGFFTAVFGYIRLLILPFDLHMEYGDKIFKLLNPMVVAGAIIFITLLIYAFWRRRQNPLLSFSILWFFTALIPSSNIYPLKAYMAEHWLYLPSVGFFLAIAGSLTLIRREKKAKAAVAIAILALLGFYSFLTIRQNIYWREPIAFYERTLTYAPGSIKAYYNLATLYKDSNRYREAVALYEKTIRYKPDFPDAYINLGVVYYDLGKYNDAITLYKRALEIDKNYQGAYYNLGNAYKAMSRYQDAIASYKKAIELKPGYADAYNNLGNLYRETGRREDALASYSKALEINPGLAYTYGNLGMIYYDMQRFKEAIVLYNKAIELDPGYAFAYNNLGMAYYMIGEFKEALRCTERAIQIDPGYRTAYFNLSLVYYSDKQFDKAIEYCDRSVALGHKPDPGFLKILEPYRRSR